MGEALELADIFEPATIPDVDQRVAAWYWGAEDEDVSWWLGMCRMVSPDRAYGDLYELHVAEDVRHKRAVKDWGYTAAATYALEARKVSVRRRAPVMAYDPEWGHQAARDGLAMAMWPHMAPEVPGRNKRCAAHHVGHQAYQRVREAVRLATATAISDFRRDMRECMEGRWSRDFRDRWEAVTGRDFPRG
jgi:hypothetical protein